MKKGITLISILATVAIIGILTTTVTLSAFKVSNDSKKLKFATEISYITEAINSYYTTNQNFPVGESITVDLTQVSEKSISQFANEKGYSERSIILYQIDKTKLGISDTIYGNGNTTNKDIYAVSKETKNVYYINGVKVSDVTYYTLTENLRKLVDYELSNKDNGVASLKLTSSETSSSSTFLGMGTRSSITKVIFEDTKKNAPSTAIDVSAASDKSIVGWLDGTEAHIASNGSIYANTNSSYLFANLLNCTAIENLNLLNTSKTTNMSYMFRYCSSLKSLDLSKFDTSKVTTMRDFLYNCSALKALNLSSFDTSNTTSMWNMFRNCSSLETLDLSNFDTSKVTDMDYMFNSCSKLKKIYASVKFVTTKLNYSSSMFGSCTNLVGGNGTKYNSSYVDKTYARIDTTATPGYFTQNLSVVIGEKQSLISNDEQEKYLFVTVKVASDSDIKSVKFEREVMTQENALIYFKNNGIELQEDIIEVKEDTKGVTVYLEDVTGKVTVVSKTF